MCKGQCGPHNRRKRVRKFLAGAGSILIIVLMAIAALSSVASATNTDPNSGHKVTLCHRTGSATNPYVQVTVDIASSGYVKGGHTGHDQVGNGLGGDIIPAYDAFAKDGKNYVAFHFDGKNLDAAIGGSTGAEILANGCQVGEQPPVEVPPVVSPAASLSAPNCDVQSVDATLDNSASEDGVSVEGDTESAAVTFDVLVNGQVVNEVVVDAGDVATVSGIAVADGDVVSVVVAGGEGALASEDISLDCGGTVPPPPPPPGGGGNNGNPPPTSGGTVTVTRQAFTL